MREHGSGLRTLFIVVVVLTIVLLVVPFTMGGRPEALRDRHSEPRPQVIPAFVAVTTAGKLYHDPRCAFIHGAAVLEPASAAVAQGFSPCPRCLGGLRADRSRLRPHARSDSPLQP